jgi:hypothetical protein
METGIRSKLAMGDRRFSRNLPLGIYWMAARIMKAVGSWQYKYEAGRLLFVFGWLLRYTGGIAKLGVLQLSHFHTFMQTLVARGGGVAGNGIGHGRADERRDNEGMSAGRFGNENYSGERSLITSGDK